jgi:hypothetical protein
VRKRTRSKLVERKKCAVRVRKCSEERKKWMQVSKTLTHNLSVAMREGCENTSEVRGNVDATTSCSLSLSCRDTTWRSTSEECCDHSLIDAGLSATMMWRHVLFMNEPSAENSLNFHTNFCMKMSKYGTK